MIHPSTSLRQAVVRPDLLVDPAFEVLSVRRLPEKAVVVFAVISVMVALGVIVIER